MEFEEIAAKDNREYIEKTDWRVRKPHVLFHENNPNKKIVVSNNWVLESDNLETMLDKPNDVAIYSNISTSNLERVKKFHKEKIIPRQKSGWGSKDLNQKELKEYYDYFEIAITSVIFAYTAIEAFANICIPNNYIYSYTDNKGIEIIDKKEIIEKSYSLRDKLKKILPDVLGCASPTQEKWWNKFTELENLRNEIIHSKDSKSEDRYSKLLSTSIIRKVDVHKDVVQYYGNIINQNKKDLLDEYPNGFGFDTYKVKKANDENFKQSSEVVLGHST